MLPWVWMARAAEMDLRRRSVLVDGPPAPVGVLGPVPVLAPVLERRGAPAPAAMEEERPESSDSRRERKEARCGMFIKLFKGPPPP